MVLGVDARPLAEGVTGGITEYTRHLLPALLDYDPQLELRLYFNAFGQNLRQESWMEDERVKVYTSTLPNRFVFNPATRFLGRPRVDKKLGSLDVFFSPQPDLIGLAKNVRQVITVHDLAYCKFPELFDGYRRRARRVQKLAYQFERASHLIAVSESTKRDLAEEFNVPEEKISVVPLGLDSMFPNSSLASLDDAKLAGVREKYGLPEQFILFMGTLEARKNVLSLIEAFNYLKEKTVSVYRYTDTVGEGNCRIGDLQLVLAGPAGYGAEEVFGAARNSPYKKDIRFLGAVESEDRSTLYQAASILALPSLYEGFGLPPLEAASQGTPVLVSHTSAMPEVMGSAALYTDPYQPRQMAGALSQLLADSGLISDLREKGKERAGQFTWQNVAQKTHQILTQC